MLSAPDTLPLSGAVIAVVDPIMVRNAPETPPITRYRTTAQAIVTAVYPAALSCGTFITGVAPR
jgi:hypothetical protein